MLALPTAAMSEGRSGFVWSASGLSAKIAACQRGTWLASLWFFLTVVEEAMSSDSLPGRGPEDKLVSLDSSLALLFRVTWVAVILPGLRSGEDQSPGGRGRPGQPGQPLPGVPGVESKGGKH